MATGNTSVSNILSSTDMKEGPRSECMKSGIPPNKNIASKHLMTISVDIFGQGKATGKRVYSSITVNKYLFLDADGKGPLRRLLIVNLLKQYSSHKM